MAMSPEPRPFDGVWGPYFGAALPGLWLCEGGQSATGALLDHLIRWHGAGGQPDAAMHGKIAARVMQLRETEGLDLAGRLHVLPDFHGNRSPLADPHAIGVVSGLTLDATFDSLCKLYWRTCVGIALGVRHILDALNERGYVIDTLHVTGGHTRNPLLMELYADATGCAVVEPQAADAVLLGTAMVAATAGGLYPDLNAACLAMQQGGTARQPDTSGASALRPRLPHLPRNAPPAAGAGCDGVGPGGAPTRSSASAAFHSSPRASAISGQARQIARRQAAACRHSDRRAAIGGGRASPGRSPARR